jgi:hypothetical protein
MSLSVVPLLLAGKSISSEARRALQENRVKDAAEILIQQYGLNCSEVCALLDISACD